MNAQLNQCRVEVPAMFYDCMETYNLYKFKILFILNKTTYGTNAVTGSLACNSGFLYCKYNAFNNFIVNINIKLLNIKLLYIKH